MEVVEVFKAAEDFMEVAGFTVAGADLAVVGFTVEAVSMVAGDFGAEASAAEVFVAAGFEADPGFVEEPSAGVFVAGSVVTACGGVFGGAEGVGEEEGVVGVGA